MLTLAFSATLYYLFNFFQSESVRHIICIRNPYKIAHRAKRNGYLRVHGQGRGCVMYPTHYCNAILNESWARLNFNGAVA